MKSSKSTRQQYEKERKNGKRSEKSSKLDRKSSRGMIYENEELRLRTININAEVERGQSDIKRLRRENEHLRREIWTLRDECDRLNKRFKAKLYEHEHGGCRGSGCSSSGCNAKHCSGGVPTSIVCDVNSDDSDSCDTCRENDGQCSDECCRDGGGNCSPVKHNSDETCPKECNNTEKIEPPSVPFDHLSVVSEETLSNLEQLGSQNEHLRVYAPEIDGSQSTLPSLVGPLTPLTPIELVANQLNDLQAVVPPLSYFENILQQHMGSNIGNSPEPQNISGTGTSSTVRRTNGWDYNLQSPFAHRKLSNNSSPSRSPGLQYKQPTLTTFVPSISIPNESSHNTEHVPSLSTPSRTAPSVNTNASAIETVAITTNAPQILNSPKHFFAPIKPRLKVNTTLANRNIPPAMVVTSEAPSMLSTNNVEASTSYQNFNPPDIFVNNALASPYEHQVLPTSNQQQRLQSSQVSPRHCDKRCSKHQLYQHHHQAQQKCQYQQHQCQQYSLRDFNESTVCADTSVGHGIDDKGPFCNLGGYNSGSLLDISSGIVSASPIETQSYISACLHNSLPHIGPNHTTCSQTNNQSCQPIYATAQKNFSLCKSANALTKPLMTATINAINNTTVKFRDYRIRSATELEPECRVSVTNKTAFDTIDYESQTDSVNLQSILNDIEAISEDLLAIQLEKNKSLENISKSRNDNAEFLIKDETKKPYRSEMNLFLNYDGTNTTITPTSTADELQIQGSVSKGTEIENIKRPCSLDRENTNSPSPHIPDPMEPFPEKCSYIGFEHINQSAVPTNIKVQQMPFQNLVKSPDNSQITVDKSSPPAPPIRMCPPVLTVQGSTSPIHTLTPNKSNLYKTIASAEAKRAAFRSASSNNMTRSLEMAHPDSVSPDMAKRSLVETNDSVKNKPNRVSIVCEDDTPESNNQEQEPKNMKMSTTPLRITKLPATTASCCDLSSSVVLPYLLGKKTKHSSHSTPNSPHSYRRNSNCNTMQETQKELCNLTTVPPTVQLPLISGHQPPGSANFQHRKESSDPAPMTATVTRTKCSRRHSEGTVHNLHRASNASSGVVVGGHHHHHNHHHQHTSALMGSNPHHSHHSHQDSNHGTAASFSDRNSNSLASSRESSTSFSMRSNRRKISISSHTGGKIPWCGCWGNGCC